MLVVMSMGCLYLIAHDRLGRWWPAAIVTPAAGIGGWVIAYTPPGRSWDVTITTIALAGGIVVAPLWGALYAQGVRWVRLAPVLVAILLAFGLPALLHAGQALAADGAPSALPVPPVEWGWPGAALLGLVYVLRWAGQGGSLPIRIVVEHRIPDELLREVRRVEVHTAVHEPPTEERSGAHRRPR